MLVAATAFFHDGAEARKLYLCPIWTVALCLLTIVQSPAVRCVEMTMEAGKSCAYPQGLAGVMSRPHDRTSKHLTRTETCPMNVLGWEASLRQLCALELLG